MLLEHALFFVMIASRIGWVGRIVTAAGDGMERGLALAESRGWPRLRSGTLNHLYCLSLIRHCLRRVSQGKSRWMPRVSHRFLSHVYCPTPRALEACPRLWPVCHLFQDCLWFRELGSKYTGSCGGWHTLGKLKLVSIFVMLRRRRRSLPMAFGHEGLSYSNWGQRC
ncbi:hypothetical protein BDR22DRAFT_865381 [Usnea florida]